MTESRVTAEVEIAASPEAVYDIVSDVTRIGEWAAETESCTWLGGATGPAVGTRFRGRNRKGWARWSTSATIVAADRGKTFSYHVRAGGVIDVAVWRFRFSSTEYGCRVTQSWEDRRHPLIAFITERALGIRHGRAGHNQQNMQRSLEGLKRLADRESS